VRLKFSLVGSTDLHFCTSLIRECRHHDSAFCRITLRVSLLTNQVLDGDSGTVHHVSDATCSDVIQTSTSDLVLCCHSDEPNHLILDWRNVLSRIPDNGSALIIGLVRIQLPAITTLSIAGQQPWFRNCLNQPVLVVERPYAFGVWCGYLQCA
jgi:hypothetical protein